MMRTTVNLESALLKEVKTLAAKSGRTFTSVLEDALQEFLTKRKTRQPQKVIRLTTVSGNGVRPGVDLDDTASLIAQMDELT